MQYYLPGNPGVGWTHRASAPVSIARSAAGPCTLAPMRSTAMPGSRRQGRLLHRPPRGRPPCRVNLQPGQPHADHHRPRQGRSLPGRARHRAQAAGWAGGLGARDPDQGHAAVSLCQGAVWEGCGDTGCADVSPRRGRWPASHLFVQTVCVSSSRMACPRRWPSWALRQPTWLRCLVFLHRVAHRWRCWTV